MKLFTCSGDDAGEGNYEDNLEDTEAPSSTPSAPSAISSTWVNKPVALQSSPSPPMRPKESPKTPSAISAAMGSTTLNSSSLDTEDPTTPHSLDENELQAIYNRDCTIRIPFLNLNYISPGSLLSREDDDEVGNILVELCGGKPFVQLEELGPNLGNLLKTLAYHKHRETTVPMPIRQAEQTARVVSELQSTLKTIFTL